MDRKKVPGGSDNDLAFEEKEVTSFSESFRFDESNGFHFDELFETMSLGVVYQNAKGLIIAANPAAEMILGLTLDQMMGRTSRDPRWKATNEDGSFLPGNEHPAMIALKTGKRVTDFIMGVFNPSLNQTRWISVDATPIFRDGSRKPYRVYTTFRDVTELRMTLESLTESEERHRTLVSSMDDLVFVTDENNLFQEYYAARDDTLYTSPEHFMNRQISEVLPEDVATMFEEIFEQVKESGQSASFDYSLPINDEIMSFSARVSLHDDGSSLVSVIRNITDRVLVEREVRKSHKELEVYASLLQHDLGNDLQVILSKIEFAELIHSPKSETHDLMVSIRAIIERMIHVLKAVGQKTEGRDETLGNMLSRVSSLSQKAHENLTIHLDIADEMCREKSTSHLRLLPIVFDNLFRNSAEHAGNGVIVEASVWTEGDAICIEVRDNGLGISEEIKSNLFKKGTTTKNGGLGLYLSKKIMEAYNGSIRLQESEPSSGAVFMIELPTSA